MPVRSRAGMLRVDGVRDLVIAWTLMIDISVWRIWRGVEGWYYP